MSDPTLLVLASLAEGNKHGYAMMEDIQQFAGWRLVAGTFGHVPEPPMTDRIEPRLVSLASRDVPCGYELESGVAFTREDGSTTLARNFSREIDLGDSYITVNHWSRGSKPATTA